MGPGVGGVEAERQAESLLGGPVVSVSVSPPRPGQEGGGDLRRRPDPLALHESLGGGDHALRFLRFTALSQGAMAEPEIAENLARAHPLGWEGNGIGRRGSIRRWGRRSRVGRLWV